jgi:hypothetical protein
VSLVTSVLAGTVLLAAMGAAALCVLVARYGIAPGAGSAPWTARRHFFARLTYFTVGASLALTGVLAAVGLAASVRSESVRMASGAAAIGDRRALESRIHALESALDELHLRINRTPADVELLANRSRAR